MANEKTRAEQEQQAMSDAHNGMNPDPSNSDPYYLAAYNNAKAQNQPPPPPQEKH
jgi:hypothetical protein